MSAVGQVRPGSRADPDMLNAPNSRPAGAPGAPTRPPLRVVPPDLIRRQARRRRRRALIVSIALVIALGMFVIVGAQVVLTQRQLRLDNMEQQLSKVQTTDDQLQLQVAELQSPSRIVSEAETRLHMLLPTSVVYLTPGATSDPTKVEGVPAEEGAATTPTTSSGVSG